MTWQLMSLSDLAEFDPSAPRNGVLSTDTEVAFLPMAGLDSDEVVVMPSETRALCEVMTGFTYFQNGDVLVAKITPCFENGKTAEVNMTFKHGFGSTEFHVIRADRSQLIPRYLVHFLRQSWVRDMGQRRMTGSAGQRRVPRAFLKELSIPVPPLSEQERIAGILDKADRIRRKPEQSVAEANALIRSVFLERFGDPLTNQRGLPKARIKAFGAVVTGNTPSRSNADNFGTAIEWIKSDNINTPNHFLTSAEEYLSETGRILGRTAPAGSTLVTCIAGSPSVIGNAALADREVAFNQQINAVIPNETTDPYFLYCQFLVGKRLIQANSTNSMKGMVSKGKFQEIEFLKPSQGEQKDFGDFFKRAVGMTGQLREACAKGRELFESLSTRAFRGEL